MRAAPVREDKASGSTGVSVPSLVALNLVDVACSDKADEGDLIVRDK
jgi:hypothetical protein